MHPQEGFLDDFLRVLLVADQGQGENEGTTLVAFHQFAKGALVARFCPFDKSMIVESLGFALLTVGRLSGLTIHLPDIPISLVRRQFRGQGLLIGPAAENSRRGGGRHH